MHALEESLEFWEEHRNSNEETWQEGLSDRAFLFQQLFSWPCTIIGEKAYVGGKTVHNKMGMIVDFLVQNILTTGAALVEIKTPTTNLVGAPYRAGVPNISQAVTGAIVQINAYKDTLMKSPSLASEDGFEVFNPQCVVIVGTVSELESTQRRSFDLFRRGLKDLTVITFDELFGRVEQTINFLRRPAVESQDEELPW